MKQVNDQTIIDGNLVAYIKSGQGQQNVVFSHGWRAEASLWAPVAKELQGFNANFYFLDLPGFGKSPLPKTALSVGDYADLIAHFIEKKKLEPVVLVGHSVGGRIAIKLAAAYPKLVEKLVLVDSAGFRIEESKRKLYGSAARVLKPVFAPKFMQGLRKKAYRVIGSGDYVETPELKETYLKIVNEDLAQYLPQIKAPTLLFWGEKDTETPLAFADKMNANIPNSTLYVLPGGGHFSFLDDPKKFADELKKFVGEK